MNQDQIGGTSVDDAALAGRRFRWLFHNSPNILGVVTAEGRIIAISESVERVLGYGPSEVVNRSLFDFVCADDQADVRAALAARGGAARDELFEFQALHRDGSRRFLEVAASDPIADPDLSGILITARDVTKRKDLQKQLLRAQRLETIGSLAGGVAHDLNNILSPVLMGIELLRQGTTDKSKLKMLQVMETSVSKGRNIVRQVLTFARGLEGEPTLIHPRHLANEVVEIIRQTFPANIQVQQDISKDCWCVLGDATQLHQVLMNLMVNARDAMPNGGSIVVSSENLVVDDAYARMTPQARPGTYVVMAIADTGTGISSKNLAKIFSAFFTTKGPEKGTGLGLSTVKHIVEGHSGFVTVESKVGSGTTFRIHLPATASAGPGAGIQAVAALSSGNGELVIVADDDESVRDITKQTLEAFGYVARVAGNGAEALALLIEERSRAKVLFADFSMPIMDGRQLTNAVRKMGMKVKVIVASGTSIPEEEREVMTTEADAILSKPFTASKLLTTVDLLLRPSG